MKAILQRAAQDLQILILTCRPRDYFGLDARHLRLEDCRSVSLPTRQLSLDREAPAIAATYGRLR